MSALSSVKDCTRSQAGFFKDSSSDANVPTDNSGKKNLEFYKVCEKLLSYKTKNVRNFVAYDIFVMFISTPYIS